MWPVELGREETGSCLEISLGTPQLSVLRAQLTHLSGLLAGQARTSASIDSGWRTRLHTVSAVPTPSLAATEVIAAHSES